LLRGGGGATRTLPRDGGVEKLPGDSTIGPPPRSGPEVKNRRSIVTKMARRRGLDAEQSRRR